MKLEIRDLDIKSDNRGIATEILTSDQMPEMKEVLLQISKPGTIRGNHYHKKKVEWICVIKGEAKIIYEDVYDGEKKTIFVSGDKPQIIKTPLDVLHTVYNIGKEDLYTISILDSIYAKMPDTYKKENP
jgi:UDP-2-acetamido-2,6-beta-L-arabino-hexul-4-ose reductase